MKKPLLAFGLILALSACADQDASPPVTVARDMGPKIALNVRIINLTDRSGIQPGTSPYATNHFSPTIAEAIKQWASDRLQATGQTGDAIIVIKDASLNAQPLPMKDGIDSWFTRQQATKYLGHASVSIEANGMQGFATAEAEASRALTLPEDPTEIEKQNAYVTMLNGLMKDLGQNLESGIRAHMSSFVADAPANAVTATSAAFDTDPQFTVAPPTLNAPGIQPPVMGAGSSASVYAVSMPQQDPLTVTSAPASLVGPSSVPTTTLMPPATIPLSGPGVM